MHCLIKEGAFGLEETNGKLKKDLQRVYSIDFFRLVCALLVVVIHTEPLCDINEIIGFITIQILPRIAVPFFFCVSGYYYIDKLEKGMPALKAYFFRVLSLYVFSITFPVLTSIPSSLPRLS